MIWKKAATHAASAAQGIHVALFDPERQPNPSGEELVEAFRPREHATQLLWRAPPPSESFSQTSHTVIGRSLRWNAPVIASDRS